MNGVRKHRSKSSQQRLVALSVSYERAHLLPRGLGAEHLRELLIGIARPILRNGASLAYAGNWKESTPERPNYTYELLQLISAEQEDNSLGGPDTNLTLGRLYNHLSWPHYLDLSTYQEAEWVNVCRIVRVSQTQAGLNNDEVVADSEAPAESDRALFSKAVTLSATRAMVVDGMSLNWPDAPAEIVPPAAAHVMLGGKTTGYSGFVPGLFEEAYLAINAKHPTYILGGFGGAAEVLSRALLGTAQIDELTEQWHRANGGKSVARLMDMAGNFRLPPQRMATSTLLSSLNSQIQSAYGKVSQALETGLEETETRELMTTRSIVRAISLVRKGLQQRIGLQSLPA